MSVARRGGSGLLGSRLLAAKALRGMPLQRYRPDQTWHMRAAGARAGAARPGEAGRHREPSPLLLARPARLLRAHSNLQAKARRGSGQGYAHVPPTERGAPALPGSTCVRAPERAGPTHGPELRPMITAAEASRLASRPARPESRFSAWLRTGFARRQTNSVLEFTARLKPPASSSRTATCPRSNLGDPVLRVASAHDLGGAYVAGEDGA